MTFRIEWDKSDNTTNTKRPETRANGEFFSDAMLFTDRLPTDVDTKPLNPQIYRSLNRYVIDVRIEAQEDHIVIQGLKKRSAPGDVSFKIHHDFFRNGLPAIISLDGIDHRATLRPPQSKTKSVQSYWGARPIRR